MTENRKSIEKVDETKSWFYIEINKSDKPFTRLTRKKKKTQITRIKNEGNITTKLTEIEIMKEYCEQLCDDNKLGNLDERDKFLEIYKLLKPMEECKESTYSKSFLNNF